MLIQITPVGNLFIYVCMYVSLICMYVCMFHLFILDPGSSTAFVCHISLDVLNLGFFSFTTLTFLKSDQRSYRKSYLLDLSECFSMIRLRFNIFSKHSPNVTDVVYFPLHHLSGLAMLAFPFPEDTKLDHRSEQSPSLYKYFFPLFN